MKSRDTCAPPRRTGRVHVSEDEIVSPTRVVTIVSGFEWLHVVSSRT
ncbi:hypothetical protein Q8F57_039055 [Paraburkholderia terrae]|nr:hypothetical protein [Paraburkholderia terrae]MDW3661360.1 hypothetical protein [Paraburkholderia terrae]